MSGPEPCELHDEALRSGPGVTDDLVRLARSPIGDECRNCPVCRSAREFVELRLDEMVGRVFPHERGGEAAWERLQQAVRDVRVTVRRSP